jgi:transposase
MSMVCGLDLHRQQITFDAADTVSGEVWRGRVWHPDRDRVRRWLRHDVAQRANGQAVEMAVEGCTGWRYVVEEIEAAGFEAHVAEPADTQAARGKKHRAKTDRSDARLLRELLQRGELPESWIPPTVILERRLETDPPPRRPARRAAVTTTLIRGLAREAAHRHPQTTGNNAAYECPGPPAGGCCDAAAWAVGHGCAR